MRILIVADFKFWAINTLCQQIKKGNPYEIKITYVHPKDVDKELPRFTKEVADFKPHLIHYMYFNTGLQLVEKIPALKEYPSIISHHNDKNILTGDYSCFNKITCATEYARKKIANEYGNNVAVKIPYCIDFDRFKYTENLTDKKIVGYCGRVVKWKRLKEVAQACKNLDYELLVMGNTNADPNYWQEVQAVGAKLIMRMECSDEELVENFKQMAVFVNNSWQNKESGTLPLLEALASGIPTVTTNTGMAGDLLHHGIDCLKTKDDCSNLEENIKFLMEDKKLAEKVRKEGWNVIKNRPVQRYAREYAKLYNQTINKEELVSIIVPTCDRSKTLPDLLKAISEIDYSNKELIIVDDSKKEQDANKAIIEGFKTDMPIRYLKTDKSGYNLALARNMGIIEAMGEYIMFLDDRLLPDRLSVRAFLQVLKNKDKRLWVHGEKGGGKKTFVENFSMVKRQDIVDIGMMNERCDVYGCLSQELRCRWKRNGGETWYQPNATAKELVSSKMSQERRDDIVKAKYLMFLMGMENEY